MFPMMGCGCSSPLCNSRRDAKMRKLDIDIKAERREMMDDLSFTPAAEDLLKQLFSK